MEVISSSMVSKAGNGSIQDEDGQSMTKPEASEPYMSPFENPHKRKRRAVAKGDDSKEDYLNLEIEPIGAADLVQKSTKRRSFVSALKVPALLYPKSVYPDHEQPVQISVESIVLQEALVSQCIWLQQEMTLMLLGISSKHRQRSNFVRGRALHCI